MAPKGRRWPASARPGVGMLCLREDSKNKGTELKGKYGMVFGPGRMFPVKSVPRASTPMKNANTR